MKMIMYYPCFQGANIYKEDLNLFYYKNHICYI